jgi:lipoprotein NlpI
LKTVAQCSDINQVDTAITACTTLINENSSDPMLFIKRAVVNMKLDKPEQAIEDLNRSIVLKPNGSLPLTLRDTVYLAKGQYNDAIHDLDLAVQFNTLKNNKYMAALLLQHGTAKFYVASPAAAIDDLVSAVQQNSTDIFSVMWLHIARVRAGQDDHQELEHNSDALLGGAWPAPVLALYRGKVNVDEVFAKAKVGDAAKQLDQMCDANFYTAELYLTRNMKAEAHPLFQAAQSTCPRSVPERSFAQTELTILDRDMQQPTSTVSPALPTE